MHEVNMFVKSFLFWCLASVATILWCCGASWAVFGGPLERLGGVSKGSWSVLEASWSHLGSVLGYLGRFLGVLPISKRSEAVLKASWERLGGAWGRLGRVWETLGKRLGASLGCFFFSVFETSLNRIARKLDVDIS